MASERIESDRMTELKGSTNWDSSKESTDSALDISENNLENTQAAPPPQDPNGVQRQLGANNSSRVQQLTALQNGANQSKPVALQRQRQQEINSDKFGKASETKPKSFSPPIIELKASPQQQSSSNQYSGGSSPILQRKAASGKPVMQLISVQIEPRDPSSGNSSRMIIESIKVKGRPTSIYTSSAGDHTTAFGVYQDGFANAIQGQTLDKAYAYCFKEFKQIQILGMNPHMVQNRETLYKNILRKVPTSLQNMKNDLQQKISAQLDQKIALSLQFLIADLLKLKEMSSLTSVNSKLADPMRTGKGHGESSRLAYLRYHEAKFKNEPNHKKGLTEHQDDQLYNAIFDLFDFAAVAGNMMQPRDRWPEVLGGLAANTGTQDVIRIFWNKHFKAIQNAYPNVVRNIKVIELKEEFESRFKEFIDEQSIAEQEKIWKMKRGCLAQIEQIGRKLSSNNEYDQKNLKVNKQNIRKHDSHFEHVADIRSRLGLKKRKFLSTRSNSKPKSSITDVKSSYNRLEYLAPNTTPYTHLWLNPYLNDDKRQYLKDSKRIGNSGASVQIELNKLGTKIKKLHLAGRPNSPFSTGMGAHTTAWTVHERGLKKKTENQTPENAKAGVDSLMEDAKKIRSERQQLFTKLFEEHQFEEMKRTELTARSLKNSKEIQTYPVLFLQKYIEAYLQFLNNIWGMTINKADTTGDGEAKACEEIERLISEYENDMEWEEYLEENGEEFMIQIEKLLDLKNVKRKFEDRLWKDHWHFILTAYPELAHLKKLDDENMSSINSNNNSNSKRKHKKKKSKKEKISKQPSNNHLKRPHSKISKSSSKFKLKGNKSNKTPIPDGTSVSPDLVTSVEDEYFEPSPKKHGNNNRNKNKTRFEYKYRKKDNKKDKNGGLPPQSKESLLSSINSISSKINSIKKQAKDGRQKSKMISHNMSYRPQTTVNSSYSSGYGTVNSSQGHDNNYNYGGFLPPPMITNTFSPVRIGNQIFYVRQPGNEIFDGSNRLVGIWLSNGPQFYN